MTIPAWTPPTGTEVVNQTAGTYWDAAKMPNDLGEHILTTLGEKSGAVIHDPHDQSLVWLIEPHTSWKPDHPSVEIYSCACWILVPPQSKTSGHGVTWRIPPSPQRYLTSTVLLQHALETS